MLSMQATHHAVARMQQRAVRPEIVDYLLDFGRCEHHQRGAQLYYLDQKRRQREQTEHGNKAVGEELPYTTQRPSPRVANRSP